MDQIIAVCDSCFLLFGLIFLLVVLRFLNDWGASPDEHHQNMVLGATPWAPPVQNEIVFLETLITILAKACNGHIKTGTAKVPQNNKQRIRKHNEKQ